jgi:hypothetical protein
MLVIEVRKFWLRVFQDALYLHTELNLRIKWEENNVILIGCPSYKA